MNYQSSFNNSLNFPPVSDLEFPTEWAPSENDQMLFGTSADPYGVTTSSIETEWQTDKMMNHQLHGDYYLDDDLEMHDGTGDAFQTQPLEELFNNALYFENEDDYKHIDHVEGGFLDPLLNVETTDYDHSDDSSIGLPLEERYKATLEKLQASMKRSQETRNCLTLKTATTESYERTGSVKEILSSIATSSGQVQKYVTSIQRPI
mmetsp:Transcript_9891/g.23871  ORF Transcript_9891/g.23871 Transcript_9891/m.23871 type:complete len:205 (-) Transcript_9891:442-1056(-)